MPRKIKPAFSKKVKKRAHVREAFYEEYVKWDPHVESVRFTHYKNQDYLYVKVTAEMWKNLPEEYMGYPVFVKTVKSRYIKDDE